MNLGARRGRLRERMAAAGCEAMLITNLPDVHYLCGFSGSNAGLLVWASGELLATDGRYVTQAAQESPGVELLVTRRIIPALLEAAPVGAVGFDPTAVTVAAVRSAQRGGAGRDPGTG
ncbi:MAG: aminopeptidase P family N-terminal domain-containing protein [Candidatus Nanopelagicales bacterium]